LLCYFSFLFLFLKIEIESEIELEIEMVIRMGLKTRQRNCDVLFFCSGASTKEIVLDLGK